jgi:hypothetical protein
MSVTRRETWRMSEWRIAWAGGRQGTLLQKIILILFLFLHRIGSEEDYEDEDEDEDEDEKIAESDIARNCGIVARFQKSG